MQKKFIGIILVVLMALAFWLNDVFQLLEIGQPKDPMTVNNEIVMSINKLQNTLREPQFLLEQFIELSELSTEEQQGTWELLELIDIEFVDEIDSVKDNLEDIRIKDNPKLASLKKQGLALVDTYHAYSPAYARIVAQIKSRELNANEIEALIATEMNSITEATAYAAEAFMLAQEAVLRGN
ncbi:MAG: hypothetical protein HKP09_08860 [Enterobacterales bacterium]|nr:hypothetical protein [Enterobacterales bacterium]